MSIRCRLIEARTARARVTRARERLVAATPEVRKWPLVSVGVAAVAGWTFGRLGARLPGATRLLTAQLLPWAARTFVLLRNPG